MTRWFSTSLWAGAGISIPNLLFESAVTAETQRDSTFSLAMMAVAQSVALCGMSRRAEGAPAPMTPELQLRLAAKFVAYWGVLHWPDITAVERFDGLRDLWDVTLKDGRTLRVQAPNPYQPTGCRIDWPEVRDGVVAFSGYVHLPGAGRGS